MLSYLDAASNLIVPFAGILFEEYNGSVTLSNGTSERLIPIGEGIAFPMGTFDTFTTYGGPANGGPANLLETANTELPRRMRRVVITAKKRSTRLSHEALVGVKCSLKRGCLSSQAFTSGVLWVA